MDLVSIKRKYRNRRNLIIAVFLLIILIILLIVVREKHLDIKNEKIYCLGEIVHNERVINDLEKNGMITIKKHMAL